MRLEDLGVVALDRPFGLARCDIIFLAIDEEDDVGVLLDRAGFAKVGELRPLVLALLDRAAELGKRQHRYVQFLGERLEARSEEHTSELQSLMRISYAVFRLKK